jgi:hypothetical protein
MQKVHKFSTKKPIQYSIFFLFFVVVQGLKVIRIPEAVRFRVQAWLDRNVSLSLSSTQVLIDLSFGFLLKGLL